MSATSEQVAGAEPSAFSADPRCPKCDRLLPEMTVGEIRDGTGQVLSCRCWKCGWRWSMRPKDWKPLAARPQPVCKESLHTDPVTDAEKKRACDVFEDAPGDWTEGMHAALADFVSRRAALAPYMGKTIQDGYSVKGSVYEEAVKGRREFRAIYRQARAELATANARIAQLESLAAEVTDEEADHAAKTLPHQLQSYLAALQWSARNIMRAALTADRQRRPVMPRRPVTGQECYDLFYPKDIRWPALAMSSQSLWDAFATRLNEAIRADTGVEHPTPAKPAPSQ